MTIHAPDLDEEYQEYGAAEPLKGYSALTSLFALAFFALWVVDEPKKPASRLEEAALLAVATHKLSRIVSRTRVTAPFRAPFTKLEGSGGGGEVEEEPRGEGLRKAIGYLLTCPYCVTPWIAVGFKMLFRFAPKAARLLTQILALVTASDFLNRLYAKLGD